MSGVLSLYSRQLNPKARPPTNQACQVSQQRHAEKRQQSLKLKIQCNSASAAETFLERQLWHFRGVASSLLGPHQTPDRRQTRQNPLT